MKGCCFSAAADKFNDSVNAIRSSCCFIVFMPGKWIGAIETAGTQVGEIASIITGHSVRLVLPDATMIKGEAVAVRDDALVVDVKSTSNAKAYSKGSASIPRASVSLIEVERRRGSWGRNVGTVVGVISGIVLGGYVAAVATDSAGTAIPTFLGITAAGTVGGAYAGKKLDEQVTQIKVIP